MKTSYTADTYHASRQFKHTVHRCVTKGMRRIIQTHTHTRNTHPGHLWAIANIRRKTHAPWPHILSTQGSSRTCEERDTRAHDAPFCLKPKMRSIHSWMRSDTWSHSSASRHFLMKSFGFDAQRGSSTSSTSEPSCRMPGGGQAGRNHYSESY